MSFASIMDYVQALFSFFIAPLFGTVLLGMLWKRATPAGGFWGLAAGTASSIGMWAWVKLDPTALRYVAMSPNAKDMAENMFRALVVLDRLRAGHGGRQPDDQAEAGDRNWSTWSTAARRFRRKAICRCGSGPIFWAGVVGGGVSSH